MRWAFLLTLGALFMGTPVWAQSWQMGCQTGDNFVASSLTPGQWACFQPSLNTDDSPIIGGSNCARVDFAQFDDYDGDGTACSTGYTVETCPSQTLTGANADNGCVQVEGTAVMTGGKQESAIASNVYLRVRSDEVAGNTDSCQVNAHCAVAAAE